MSLPLLVKWSLHIIYIMYLALCDRRGGNKASVTADINGVVRNACSLKGTLSRGRTGIVVNIVKSCCGKYLLFIKVVYYVAR